MIKIRFRTNDEKIYLIQQNEKDGILLLEELNTFDGDFLIFGTRNEQSHEPPLTLEERLAQKEIEIQLLKEAQAATDSTVLELMETILLGGI